MGDKETGRKRKRVCETDRQEKQREKLNTRRYNLCAKPIKGMRIFPQLKDNTLN